ncbi:unnamed protein product [Caenorhabditis sp. 36 PRJEB53466]|nr:unnamed protein product [Caenorhabditis sp. 36 PRJEB53466]
MFSVILNLNSRAIAFQERVVRTLEPRSEQQQMEATMQQLETTIAQLESKSSESKRDEFSNKQRSPTAKEAGAVQQRKGANHPNGKGVISPAASPLSDSALSWIIDEDPMRREKTPEPRSEQQQIEATMKRFETTLARLEEKSRALPQVLFGTRVAQGMEKTHRREHQELEAGDGAALRAAGGRHQTEQGARQTTPRSQEHMSARDQAIQATKLLTKRKNEEGEKPENPAKISRPTPAEKYMQGIEAKRKAKEEKKQQPKKTFACVLCVMDGHKTATCPRFETQQQRETRRVELGLCLICGAGHSGKCRYTKARTCELCPQNHLTWLCNLFA